MCYVIGDVFDFVFIVKVIDGSDNNEVGGVFYLVVVVSGIVEVDFDLGMCVNLDGMCVLFDVLCV